MILSKNVYMLALGEPYNYVNRYVLCPNIIKFIIVPPF